MENIFDKYQIGTFYWYTCTMTFSGATSAKIYIKEFWVMTLSHGSKNKRSQPMP